jgi:hypothetical protein
MKTKNYRFFLSLIFIVLLTASANAQLKESFLGKWAFNAPSAPEGYMNGIIELKPDTAIISFNDVPYSFVSNWVKVRNDSLIFETFINNGSVLFSLKLEKEKIEGEAVWDEGETLISLSRDAKKE